MALACDCCGHPSANKYKAFKACNLCMSKNPEELYVEAHVKDGESRRGK